MADEWAIMDGVGIIHRGTEEEIKSLWEDPDQLYMKQEIVGDLLLIEIHGIVK